MDDLAGPARDMPTPLIERVKDLVRRFWPIRFLVFLILRPKAFLDEFVYSLQDYRRFRASLRPVLPLLTTRPSGSTLAAGPGLLVVAGQAMNTQWCQLWCILASSYRDAGYHPYVLTSRNQPIRNLYFRLTGLQAIYMEDLSIQSIAVPDDFTAQVAALTSFTDFKAFACDGVPFGQIAMSTYGRLRTTGIVDVSKEGTRQELRRWIRFVHQTMTAAARLYERYRIDLLFFTEVFMEEYGGLYYAALNRRLNIIRFAGTVRDDAVVVQHLTPESDRTHHAALSPGTWARISAYPDTPAVDRELEQNFLDRYGDRWALSKRNQPNTRVMPLDEAKAELGIAGDPRPVAVIFSHILYDTLFFFGEDLFPIYADWFVASVKAACANPNVLWYVKVHPSNLWRGELDQYFGGKYQEVRLIEQHVGTLPEHVRLVYPDTVISPYTWFQLADFGITVRGTSGIELAALGKPVITAGSGRYESMGFSINPPTAEAYLSLLANLPHVALPTLPQRRQGVRFAYATFCMKPYTLDFLRAVPRTGKSAIFASEDLVYLAAFDEGAAALPESIRRFKAWGADRQAIDFLTEWPAQ